MHHAQKDKDISHYNSFEVFEDIYKSGDKGNFNQLEMPESNPRRYSFFYGFALWDSKLPLQQHRQAFPSFFKRLIN